MPTPEEISAWSAEEIEAEIYRILPESRTLSIKQHTEGFCVVQVLALDPETLQPVPVCEESSADPRLALLNIYGTLYLRTLPKSAQDTHWARRQELRTAQVPRKSTEPVPDPGDLDPVEVERLYQTKRK